MTRSAGCQLSSGLGSSFQTKSLWICSIRRVTRQSSHRLSPSSNSQTCPSGISERRFLRQLGQKINTGIMALPVCMRLLAGSEFTNLRSQRLLNAPSFGEAIREGVWVHPDSSCPLCYGKCNAIMRDIVGRALVIVLLFVCFPSHVAGFIVPVIINPSYGCSSERLQSHVCKEVIEGVSPFIADCNPTESIVCETWVVRIVAARSHVLPTTIFARLSACSVGCVSVSGYSAPSATGLRFTISESYTDDDQLRAALASAVPVRTFVRFERFSSVTDYSEFSVNVTDFVFCSWINPQWATFAASLAAARCKIVSCDDIRGAAVAQDIPVNDFASPLSKASHYKTSKVLSSKIFEIVGASARIVRRHDSTPLKLDYCESSRTAPNRLAVRIIMPRMAGLGNSVP